MPPHLHRTKEETRLLVQTLMKGEWSSIEDVLTDTFPAPVPPSVPVQFDEDDFDEDDDITPWNVMIKTGKPKKLNSNQRNPTQFN